MTEEAPSLTPPNLRTSDGEEKCENCEYYHYGDCALYRYPVKTEEVCDNHTPKSS